MTISLHRTDIDHATADVDTMLESFGLTAAQRLGVEAVAALHTQLYSDPSRPRDEQLQESRRWDVMSCLLGVNWLHPEIVEGLAEGITRERMMEIAEIDRKRLLDQAEWIGEAVSAYLSRSGIKLP